MGQVLSYFVALIGTVAASWVYIVDPLSRSAEKDQQQREALANTMLETFNKQSNNIKLHVFTERAYPGPTLEVTFPEAILELYKNGDLTAQKIAEYEANNNNIKLVYRAFGNSYFCGEEVSTLNSFLKNASPTPVGRDTIKVILEKSKQPFSTYIEGGFRTQTTSSYSQPSTVTSRVTASVAATPLLQTSLSS